MITYEHIYMYVEGNIIVVIMCVCVCVLQLNFKWCKLLKTFNEHA